MGLNNSKSRRNSSPTPSSANSITPLYEACRNGNEEEVRALLLQYSLHDLNRAEPLYGGNTCLHVAAANGHENIVKLLLRHGSYRSASLNKHNQSAYDVAESNNGSMRSLFLRQNNTKSTEKFSSRFYEENSSDCFDIVRVDRAESSDEDNGDDTDNEKSQKARRVSSIQTYKNEDEKEHAIEYSASSKAMCQSRVGRFCINHLHSDEPLDHHTITKRLNRIAEQIHRNQFDDDIKISDLIEQYEENPNSIELLLHLYTLETPFYHQLKEDCLPLALPIFIHLPKLKERYFKGRVYRGMHLTYEQLLGYQLAMETTGTLLQTRSFSSTSKNRLIAEQFAYETTKNTNQDLHVLFIFDFPEYCDQAINLSRVSPDIPCLSEYEDEEEVLILPWTLFEVTRVRKASNEDDFYTINLTNIIIPNKNLLSTFKWSWVELKNQFVKEKKLKFDCGFQKYKPSVTSNKLSI
ncbi:unnamed protein product [Adineta ricciae]|uniref:NAD(+)--protein-arginine ADP-ribosyltransferase n=1 Tax=Adineta ricciae TaxID=249248 RepID=A0A815U5G6_ADIRI|nr:unnamed protein product [Adineta ricciae]